jgi:hypothetical protein
MMLGQDRRTRVSLLNATRKCVTRICCTFVALLNACDSVVTLEEGKCAHDHIIQSGWDSNVFLGSSLVDMYAKCKSLYI